MISIMNNLMTTLRKRSLKAMKMTPQARGGGDPKALKIVNETTIMMIPNPKRNYIRKKEEGEADKKAPKIKRT
jgi:hypothetical protein